MSIFERWKNKIKSCYPPHSNYYPVITGVTLSAGISGQVQVLWTTDIPSTSQVFYGRMPTVAAMDPLPQKSAFDSALVTSHLVIVSGLLDSPVRYRFQPYSSYKDSLTRGSFEEGSAFSL